jgi:uncharacterized Zn-finger protein
MGKATGVGAIVFGVILVLLGIGAYFSGEASSQTDQGRIAIAFAIILGLAAILGGVNAREEAAKKEAAKAVQAATAAAQTTTTTVTTVDVPPPPPDSEGLSFCPYCGREIQSDFVVCPFCGKSVKNSCPRCGKEVKSEFVACPYCGTSLKKA